MFKSLTTSEIIEIAGIITSLITSLTAIIISTFSLRQNAKMIESSTRPYICIYSKTTNFKSIYYYLILKNCGQSGAVITSFNCNYDLSKMSYNSVVKPFEHIEGTFIAPGQSFTYSLDTNELFKCKNIKLIFSFEYVSNGKKYSETVTIDPKAEADQILARSCTSGQELQTISYTLQDIAEKLL